MLTWGFVLQVGEVWHAGPLPVHGYLQQHHGHQGTHAWHRPQVSAPLVTRLWPLLLLSSSSCRPHHFLLFPQSHPRPKWRPDISDVSPQPPVWKLRAVIWFHFSVCSLLVLFCLVLVSFFCSWPIHLPTFQKKTTILICFPRDGIFFFCMALVFRCVF